MGKVILAEHAGFCAGVKRAVDLAELHLKSGRVIVDGSLIHNDDVMKSLIEKGLQVWDGKPVAEGVKVLVKSHGAPLETIEKMRGKQTELIDATCPHVQRIYRIAEQAAQENAFLIIYGESDHPEIKGIVSRASEKVAVTKNSAEVLEILLRDEKKYVVSQTTSNFLEWVKFTEEIKKICSNINIFNTICPATTIRQRASVDLARQVDIMLIVGGYNSSNTRRLHELCNQAGVRAYHIANAADIDRKWFPENDVVVGVTAGASTPDWVIKEVIVQMEKNLEKDAMVTEEATENTEAVETEESVSESAEEVTNEADAVVEEVEEEVTEEKQEEAAQPSNMEEILNDDVATIKRNSIVTGKVVKVNDDEVLVDIGYKSEGIIKLRELTNDTSLTPTDIVSEGDEIEVFVVRVSDDNGNPVLSRKRAQAINAWNKVREAFENKEIVSGKVLEAVKGGLLVNIYGMRAFLPASLVDRSYVPDLNVFVGQEISAKIIEIDRHKRRVVLSRQVVLEEEYKQNQEKTWNKLEVDQVLDGIVQRITKFGVFVDIGSVDGLVHISELSWGRVEHPSEVINEGEEVQVKVLGVDRENERVSLSIRQVLPDPWTKVDVNYKAGDVKEGKVVRTVSFGVFVELEPGIEGLVHISQLAWQHVEKAEDVVKPGDIVSVKVLSVNKDEKRISLSVKETTERPPRKEKSSKQSRTVEHTEASSVTLGDMFGDLLSKAKKKS